MGRILGILRYLSHFSLYLSRAAEAPFTQQNKYIHTVNDTADKLDFEYVNEFACLALSYVVELGSK